MVKRQSVLLSAIFVAVVLVISVVVVRQFLTGPYPGHNDFMSRWEGARSFFVDGLNPYGEQASLNIQKAIYGGPARADQDPGYFAYPIYTAFLVWPLVYMSYDWASAIWMVALAGCLIASLFLLFNLFNWKPSPLVMGFLFIWVLLFYYSARGLILGQPGIVVYFLELLAIWALFKGHDGLAGVALAMSTIKPQMGFLIVPFLLLWAIRFRRRRFLVWFAASIVVLLVASFLLEPSWVGDWLAQLRLYPSYTALGSPVWIVTSYYLGLGGWAEAVINVVLVFVMLATWWTALQGRNERLFWSIVVTVTVTHLIAPRTATPHYIVFLIPIIFYFAVISYRNRKRGSLWVLLAMFCLLIIPWLQFLVTVQKQFEHPSVYLPLPLIIMVLLVFDRHRWWNASQVPVVQ
ncbi:MAG: glycosyltransferase family 87 protein [Anaerolineae bacterium]